MTQPVHGHQVADSQSAWSVQIDSRKRFAMPALWLAVFDYDCHTNTSLKIRAARVALTTPAQSICSNSSTTIANKQSILPYMEAGLFN